MYVHFVLLGAKFRLVFVSHSFVSASAIFVDLLLIVECHMLCFLLLISSLISSN